MDVSKLSNIVDTSVFEDKNNCKVTFSDRRGQLNCSLCTQVHKSAKENPITPFVNFFPGAGKNYDKGLVFLTNISPNSEMRILTPAVGNLVKEFLSEFHINNFYVLPAVKCDIQSLGLKETGKIKSTCLQLTDYMLKNVLKPKVIVTDDISTFNQLTGLQIASAGRIAGHVLWNPEYNCYIMISLNLTMVVSEPHYSNWEEEIESVKKASVRKCFETASKILKGGYKEHITRCDDLKYKKVDSTLDDSEIESVFSRFENSEEWSLDIETTGLVPWEHKITMIGMSPAVGEAYLFPYSFVEQYRDRFQKLFSNKNIRKVFANGVFDVGFLTYHGWKLEGPFIDVHVFNYLARNGIDYDVSLHGTAKDYTPRRKAKGTGTLKYLSWHFTDLGGYEKELKKAGGIVQAQLNESQPSMEQMSLFESLMVQEINPDSKHFLKDVSSLTLEGEKIDDSLNIVEKYCAADADATLRIKHHLQKRLNKTLIDFYHYLLEPLIFKVIVDTYIHGIHVDLDYLKKLEYEYSGDGENLGKLQELESSFIESLKKEILESNSVTPSILQSIFKQDLKKFNVEKPELTMDQLKQEMVEKININIDSSSKILQLYKSLGYLGEEDNSVDSDVLSYLANTKNIPSAGYKLKYQPINKLYTTYVQPIKEKQIDGFLHSEYHAAFTTTGRLSSSSPNMQNIPASSKIRNIFIPREGYSFIDLDYSQMELRIAAEYANDETFIETFKNNKDPHWEMCMRMFNINFPYRPDADSEDDIAAVAKHIGESIDNKQKIISTIKDWDKKRGAAKTLNFSILYGSSAYGVAQSIYKDDFNYVSKDKRKQYIKESEKLIDSWFTAAPKIKKWMDDNLKFVKKNRYAKNMFGRIRWLIFINSNYRMFASAAAREAGNTPIQSTASDICSLAAVKFHELINDDDHKSDDCRIVNIVHDNILAEVPDNKANYYFEKLKKIMQEDVNILTRVPLDVDGKITKKWEK